MYGYFTSSPNTQVPFYCHPTFWVPVLVLLILVLFKTLIAHAWPPAKPFLEAVDVVVVRKSSYVLVALPVVLERLQHAFVGGAGREISAWIPFGVVHAASSGAAQGGPAESGLLMYFAGALVVFGSVSVWLLSHTIDVLALLPIPLADLVLRMFRLAVLAVLVVLPSGYRAAVSLAIMAIALLLSRWAWRLTVMGTTFALDLLLFRWKRTAVVDRDAVAFSGRGLRGVPKRTKGIIVRNADEIDFLYRDWLFRRKARSLDPAEITLGIGFVYHCLLQPNAEDDVVVVRFPPRYRDQHGSIQGAFRLAKSREIGARRFWSSLKALRRRRIEPGKGFSPLL
jgi:hypothetical protein